MIFAYKLIKTILNRETWDSRNLENTVNAVLKKRNDNTVTADIT
jgi:hypothetical protein